MADEIDECYRVYGKVLFFMHWAMNEPNGKTKPFGDLLRLGCETLHLPYPPPDIEQAILKIAFKLAAGDIPFTTVFA